MRQYYKGYWKMNEMIGVDNLKSLSNDELKQLLAQGLTISAKQLTSLSLVWRELEDRGEDLSALKSGLAVYLPMIANDQLDAEVVVKFAGQQTLLAAVMKLPIDSQRELLASPMVDYVQRDEDGEIKKQQVLLTRLSPSQVKQVIRDGRVLNASEQEKELNLLPIKRQRLNRKRISRKITFEQVEGLAVMSVSGKRIKVDDVIKQLKQAGYLWNL